MTGNDGMAYTGAFSLTTDGAGNMEYWSFTGRNESWNFSEHGVLVSSAYSPTSSLDRIGFNGTGCCLTQQSYNFNDPGTWTVEGASAGTNASSSPEPGTVWMLLGAGIVAAVLRGTGGLLMFLRGSTARRKPAAGPLTTV